MFSVNVLKTASLLHNNSEFGRRSDHALNIVLSRLLLWFTTVFRKLLLDAGGDADVFFCQDTKHKLESSSTRRSSMPSSRASRSTTVGARALAGKF